MAAAAGASAASVLLSGIQVANVISYLFSKVLL